MYILSVFRVDIAVRWLCGGDLLTEVGEVYRCEVCGNVVKVLEAGVGVLVCCGEDMVKQE